MLGRLIFPHVIFGLSVCAFAAHADDTFQNKIAPILRQRCAVCHNDEDMKGDFSIKSKEAVIANQFVEPGDSESSYLIVQPQLAISTTCGWQIK